MSRLLSLLAALLAFAVGTPAAAAEVYTWRVLFGEWSNAQNWSPAGVPTEQDTAIINNGGVPTISAPAEVLRLELTQGTLIRNAPLTVHGGFRWASGQLKGPGAITLGPNAQSEILGGSFSELSGGGPLNNEGTLVWTSGSFTATSNVELNNRGLFEALSNGTIHSCAGFNNSGTFRKVGGASVTELQSGCPLNNTGLVEVRSGTLSFRAGQSSGHFTGDAGSVLRIGGNAVLTETSLLETQGELDFSLAVRVFVKGSVDVAGETRVGGDQTHLLGTVSRLGAVRVTGGTLNVSTNAISIPSLRLLKGTLSGTAPITVTDFFTWAGGELKGAAPLIVGPRSNAEILGAESMALTQQALQLQGLTIWTSTSSVAMGNGALLLNEGSFEARSKGLIVHNSWAGGSQSDFRNTGTFTLTAADTFSFQHGVRFSNDGFVRLERGTLQFNQGTSTGRFESLPQAVLAVAGGWWHTLADGAALDMQGPLRLDRDTGLHVNGTLTLPQQVVLNGGTLAPNGVVRLPGQLEWLSGGIDGTGTLVIEPGAVMTHTGAAQRVMKARFENHGSLFFEGTASTDMGTRSVVNNTGLIELRAATQLGGTATINNLPGGIVRKAAGTSTATFSGVRLNNHGTVEVLGGELAFNNGWPFSNDTYYQEGGTTALKGGTLSSFAITSGLPPSRLRIFINGGVLEGSGTVKANVVSAGTVRPGLDAQTTGTLAIQGTYTQTAAGALRIGIGGNTPGTGYGRLDVTEARLDGKLELVRLNGYVPPTGESLIPLRWLNGTMTGGFSQVLGQDFGPDAFLLFKYTASDLTLYNSRATLADVDVEVVGPGAGRPGTSTNYTVRIRNRNNVPMVVPVVLRLSQSSQLDMTPFQRSGDAYTNMVNHLIPGTPIPPPPGPGEEYPAMRQYFPSADGKEFLVPLMVVVPAGGTYEQSVKTGCGAGVGLDMGKPFNANQLSDCLFAASSLILEFVPGYACTKLGVSLFSTFANQQTTGKAISWFALTVNTGFSTLKCMGDLIPASKAMKVMLDAHSLIGKMMAGENVVGQCIPLLLPEDKGGQGEAACVNSRDPNDKVGPVGFTAERYITGEGRLDYTVFFENDPDATAPAQTVLVTDTLDATAVDFSTFSLGTFTWGTTTVMAPPGSKTFTQDVDMRPAMNLIVRVEAGLNERTGVLTWRFTSLDPVTKLPTEDPLAGFLPPNQTKPQGEGILTYSVKAKPNLVHGTTFGSGARIIFDTNEPIDTLPWTNRIDTRSPESQVLPLSLDTQGRIVVTWSGTDAGAGVKDNSIFVSVDGGEYTKWLSNTAATTALFTGDVTQHHYAFYSVARDLLDHVEAAPPEPDATSDGLGVPPVCPPESLGSPTLVLQGSSTMTLECGQSTWVDPGATAWDGCGLPLEVHRYNSGQDPHGPGPNTSAEGTYSVEYIAWDASGATVSALRTVHVDDRTAPTLTLKGPAHMTHACGSQWVDPGVEAIDACYGDVSATINKSGYVNGWVPGQYTVTYSVRDSGGNSAPPVSRTVQVTPCPW